MAEAIIYKRLFRYARLFRGGCCKYGSARIRPQVATHPQGVPGFQTKAPPVLAGGAFEFFKALADLVAF
jgi:hypothetical protein